VFKDTCGGGLERIPPPQSLRILRGDKKGNSARGYNWATLFLGDINTGTWSSRLGESKNWDNKIWSWVPRDSDPSVTALATTSSNSRLQTRPLVREGATK
jgi:hypothetical protein